MEKFSQKDISFLLISKGRSEGFSDDRIIKDGGIFLLSLFREGKWEIKSPNIDISNDLEIIRYSRSLIKNWMKKDKRLNFPMESNQLKMIG